MEHTAMEETVLTSSVR